MSIVNLIAPLNNLGVTCDCPITLDENISIYEIPDHVKDVIKNAQESRFIRHPSNATHCLVIANAKVTSEDGTDAKEIIEEAVLRLRIYKEGGVYFDFGIIDKSGWYFDPKAKRPAELKLIGVFFYVSWERRGLPSVFELNNEDVEPLSALFSQTLGQILMDRQPFRYLFRGYHEPYATDRFLSNAIALENIFANDQEDKSNIKYKVVDRGCFVLQQVKSHHNGPNGYAKPLSDIYDARSKLVHSMKISKRDWNSDDEIMLLVNSETYLRMALHFIINNTEMSDSKKIDEAKRNKY